jgi:hypothetical protein
MTSVRIWTAVSYNWSIGNTHINVFNGPYDSPAARTVFEKQYPGESLVALVQGDHGTSSTSFPLTGPGEGDLKSNEGG